MDPLSTFYPACLFFITSKTSKPIDSGLALTFHFLILLLIVSLRISLNTRSLLTSRCEGHLYLTVAVLRHGLEVKPWGRGQAQSGGVRLVHVGPPVLLDEEALGVTEVGGELDLHRGRFLGFCSTVNAYRSCLTYNIKKVEVL